MPKNNVSDFYFCYIILKLVIKSLTLGVFLLVLYMLAKLSILAIANMNTVDILAKNVALMLSSQVKLLDLTDTTQAVWSHVMFTDCFCIGVLGKK